MHTPFLGATVQRRLCLFCCLTVTTTTNEKSAGGARRRQRRPPREASALAERERAGLPRRLSAREVPLRPQTIRVDGLELIGGLRFPLRCHGHDLLLRHGRA